MHFEDQAGRHIFYPWLSKARSEIAFGHQELAQPLQSLLKFFRHV